MATVIDYQNVIQNTEVYHEQGGWHYFVRYPITIGINVGCFPVKSTTKGATDQDKRDYQLAQAKGLADVYFPPPPDGTPVPIP